MLEALPGWTWDPNEDDFVRGLEYLTAYASKHGHCRVPLRYETADGFALGKYSSNRRRDYKNGKLSADRVNLLEALPGWIWEA